MDEADAIEVLAALAQPTRLGAFRALVRAEPEGLAAGEVARALAVPHNTLSTHLGILQRAGLVTVERLKTSMIYRADLPRLNGLVMHLVRDCCGGRPELCAPLFAALSPCLTEETTCD